MKVFKLSMLTKFCKFWRELYKTFIILLSVWLTELLEHDVSLLYCHASYGKYHFSEYYVFIIFCIYKTLNIIHNMYTYT